MNKTKLINAVSEKSKLCQKNSESVVEAIFDVITQSLVNGNSFAVFGFGKFEVCQREERTGLDPKTGEEFIIQAGKVPVFRASKSLIQQIYS